MRVAIAAAGSGGHVYPALAVADALRIRGLDFADVIFFGGDRMEATTVPEAGYPFVEVDIHGLRRSLSVDNALLGNKIRKARSTIAEAIRSMGIEAMVVFGGYVAGPAALAASRTGIPLYVHEANAVPGLANRLIARRAAKVYVAFPQALARLPGAEVIGNPLRPGFRSFDRTARRASAREKYGIAGEATVLGVVGGSLGAQFLNEVAMELASHADRSYVILHVTGSAHHTALSAASHDDIGWITIAFEGDMPDLYAASDVVLSRAGAMTVSEITATGTPAIIVPLPAGKGYQAENASSLVAAGGAILVPQTSISDICEVVVGVIDADDQRAGMRSAMASMDIADAASVMADAIMGGAHA
jgi:UDP-N-acetylglucosamine--N-acetylmuramyl-(pentapeptide) pyrophosphoryl-undecaprenol N-acetylglucosamine transferase